MRTKAILILAALVAVVGIAQPAFGQGKKSKCDLSGFMQEAGAILANYAEVYERDRRRDCKMLDLTVYKNWNTQIWKILKKHKCSWDDLEAFVKVKSKEDICGGLPLVPLVDVVETPADDKKPAHEKVKPDDTKKPESKPVVTVRKTPPNPEKTAITLEKAPPPKKSYWLTWTGTSVGGVGLVLLGVGGYFGVESKNAADNAANAIVQLDVDRFNREASDNADKANILFGIGGAMVAIGAAMVILDLTVWRSPGDTSSDKSSATIGVSPGGVHLMVRF